MESKLKLFTSLKNWTSGAAGAVKLFEKSLRTRLVVETTGTSPGICLLVMTLVYVMVSGFLLRTRDDSGLATGPLTITRTL